MKYKKARQYSQSFSGPNHRAVRRLGPKSSDKIKSRKAKNQRNSRMYTKISKKVDRRILEIIFAQADLKRIEREVHKNGSQIARVPTKVKVKNPKTKIEELKDGEEVDEAEVDKVVDIIVAPFAEKIKHD